MYDIVTSQCFIAGTLVLTEDGEKPIEEIRPGDRVFASDPETGETGYKEVVQTFENETEELVHIYVNGDEIVSTPTHPFYSPQRGWTSAVDLKAGDILVLSNGEYVVVEQVQHEILEAPVKVYNFEVQDFHTYYVGKNSVLVHNYCDIIPSVRNGEFEKWFDKLSDEEFDRLWSNKSTQNTIKRRLRSPGGYHEWLPVSKTPTFRKWGCTAEDIRNLRTITKNVKFVNPVGFHGGANSGSAHNEIFKLIDSSTN